MTARITKGSIVANARNTKIINRVWDALRSIKNDEGRVPRRNCKFSTRTLLSFDFSGIFIHPGPVVGEWKIARGDKAIATSFGCRKRAREKKRVAGRRKSPLAQKGCVVYPPGSRPVATTRFRNLREGPFRPLRTSSLSLSWPILSYPRATRKTRETVAVRVRQGGNHDACRPHRDVCITQVRKRRPQ